MTQPQSGESSREVVLSSPNIPAHLHNGLKRALGQAVESVWLHGADMPVGAIALHEERIVGVGYASDRRLNDPLLHAEAVAIFDASSEPIDTVITTLEPCVQCQDFIADQPGIKQVAYGLPRLEASNRGLIRHHDETAGERAERMQLPFEIVRLDDPSLRAIGRSILDSVSRNPDTNELEINSKTLLGDMVRLNQLGHSLDLE